MYSPAISEADFEYSSYAKDHSDHYKIRQRMQMLYLLNKGYCRNLLADIIGVHRKTILEWVILYVEGGLSALCQLGYKGQPSELQVYKEQLLEAIEKAQPSTLSEIADLIERETGIRRGLTQVSYFVREHLGLKRRKYQPLPGGKKSMAELANIQQDFVDKTLNPLLERAKKGEVEVFFCDATHPVMGFHAGYVYGKEPAYRRSAHGRHRVNLLSALHATTQQLYTIYGEQYVNAETTVELIEHVQTFYPKKKLYFIMDNARYQRCGFVKQMAQKKQVELIFLPAYSPNLNLIERVWKYLKKQVLSGKFYPTKQAFEEAIIQFLDEMDQGKHQAKLKTLLSLKFQLFKNEFVTNLAG